MEGSCTFSLQNLSFKGLEVAETFPKQFMIRQSYLLGTVLPLKEIIKEVVAGDLAIAIIKSRASVYLINRLPKPVSPPVLQFMSTDS